MPYLIFRSCRWLIWRGTVGHKTVSYYEFNSFQQLQLFIVHPIKKNQSLVRFLYVPNSLHVFCLFVCVFFGGKFSTTKLFQTSVLTTMAVQRDEHQKAPERTIKPFHSQSLQFSMVQFWHHNVCSRVH